FGYDFITFWTAGDLTLHGNPAGAFDPTTIVAAQQQIAPGNSAIYLWHYPPTYQLIAAGLALLPYLPSLALFTLVGIAAYGLVLRQLVPWREATVILLALPGAFTAVIHGQNSLISAALICAALLTLDRRPIVSGAMIGLLAYKPQLAALFPLVLAATGRWRTFVSAGITALAFAALATVVLGIDLWATFIGNAKVLRTVLEDGQLPWAKMPTAFVTVAMLGGPKWLAYTAQALVALTAAIVTVAVWRRCGTSPLAGGTLVVGTLLLPPYTYDYELAMLAIPLAALARDMILRGAGTGGKIMLLIVILTPAVMSAIAAVTGIQVGFFVLAATFAWCAGRALRSTQANRADPYDWLPGRMFAALN
ncbi:MAG: glycosyltransferase family 87 protein, partial [Hyphomicrobiaceae bacterium]